MENYGTLADADAYHAARGNAAWAGKSDSDKQAALIRASTYVDALGADGTSGRKSLYPGQKTGGRAQFLAWPRTGAYDVDGFAIDPATVPLEVLRATYEAALREVVEPGSLSPDYNPSQEMIKREKVAELETEYALPTRANPTQPIITIVREILRPVLTGPVEDVGIFVV